MTIQIRGLIPPITILLIVLVGLSTSCSKNSDGQMYINYNPGVPEIVGEYELVDIHMPSQVSIIRKTIEGFKSTPRIQIFSDNRIIAWEIPSFSRVKGEFRFNGLSLVDTTWKLGVVGTTANDSGGSVNCYGITLNDKQWTTAAFCGKNKVDGLVLFQGKPMSDRMLVYKKVSKK